MSGRIVLVTGAGTGIGRAIALVLARAGDRVYASLRTAVGDGERHAAEIRLLAQAEALDLDVVDLDVRSEASCRAAVDRVLAERGRLDVVVNNAGMLMTGVAEAFDAEQFQTILDTNAVSWLRVNQAALPAMRRQRGGTLVYVSSTTAHLAEPFLGLYAASKAAGEMLAEIMGMEARPFGIDTIIAVPGAFTSGTEHFAHARGPARSAVVDQYGPLPERAATLPARLAAIDAENGVSLDVSAVGEAIRDALAEPAGRRPHHVFVDGQRKGTETLLAVQADRQADLLGKFGLADLLPPRPAD